MMLRGLLWLERSGCRGATLLLGAGLSLLAVAGAFGWQDGSTKPNGVAPATEASGASNWETMKRRAAQMTMEQLIEAVKGEVVKPTAANMSLHDELSARLADPQWADRVRRAVQADIDAGAGILRSMPSWYEGQPYAVWLRVPHWLRRHEVTATVVSPTTLVGEKAKAWRMFSSFGQCGNSILAQEAEETYQVLGVLPECTASVTMQLSFTKVEWLHSRSDDSSVRQEKAIWSGEVTLPVEIVPRRPAVAVSTPDIDAAVRESVSMRTYVSKQEREDGGPEARFQVWVSGGRSWSGPLRPVLFPVAVDLCYDGTPVAIWYMPDPDEVNGEAALFREREELRGVIAEKLWNGDEIERFTLRVRGVQPEQTSRWCRMQYWGGSYTVPLADVYEKFVPARSDRNAPDGSSFFELIEEVLNEKLGVVKEKRCVDGIGGKEAGEGVK